MRRVPPSRTTRTLAINETEAETIRTLFRLYGALKNVRQVQAELHRLKLTTKPYVAATGRRIGGLSFSRGHIYRILSNPLYTGEIEHKGTRHPGQHPAIIDRETWNAVQAQLRVNGHANRTRRNAKDRSLLAGLLFNERGDRLIATHAVKNGKRYRYYEVPRAIGRSLETPKPSSRIAAHDIEVLVLQQLVKLLTDQQRLTQALGLRSAPPGEISRTLSEAKRVASLLGAVSTPERESILSAVGRVVLGSGRVSIELKPERLMTVLTEESAGTRLPGGDEAPIVIETETAIAPRNSDTAFVLTDGSPKSGARNPALIKAIARGKLWFDMLAEGRVTSTIEIAQQEGVTDRYVGQLLEYAFLAPPIVEGVLDGCYSTLIVKRPTLLKQIPLLWNHQMALLCGEQRI